jgi:hypothetical protein
MPFMVIYRTSDGTTRYEQADAIDEAAHFVERLRNNESSEEIHIFRMEEISFAFRPYYKVELGMPERRTEAPVAAASAPSVLEVPVPPAPVAAEAPTPAPEVDEPTRPDGVAPSEADAADAVDAGGARRGLFGR